MTVNISVEKDLNLSTQEIYDICDFSVQAAYDNGFINSFIFERALYVFAAIRLYPDEADKITELAAQNINDAWSFLLEEDIIDAMIQDYKNECDYLARIGEEWFDDYRTYAHSARGLLDTLQLFTGDIVTNAAQQFKQLNDGSEIQEVINIADNLGMNNSFDSVFEE